MGEWVGRFMGGQVVSDEWGGWVDDLVGGWEVDGK